MLHEVPDGTSHFDFLLQRPGDPNAPLIAFRVWSRPDDARILRFPAQRIPDHRALYLEFEGDVSGGRGRVSRVASGTCTIHAEEAGSIDATVQLGKEARRLLARANGALWWFNVAP